MTEPADVRFPVPDTDDLRIPEGQTSTSVGFVLARLVNLGAGGQDVAVHEVLDRMQYEDGALVTRSWPMLGLTHQMTLGADCSTPDSISRR